MTQFCDRTFYITPKSTQIQFTKTSSLYIIEIEHFKNAFLEYKNLFIVLSHIHFTCGLQSEYTKYHFDENKNPTEDCFFIRQYCNIIKIFHLHLDYHPHHLNNFHHYRNNY